jgi:hypothetical protein
MRSQKFQLEQHDSAKIIKSGKVDKSVKVKFAGRNVGTQLTHNNAGALCYFQCSCCRLCHRAPRLMVRAMQHAQASTEPRGRWQPSSAECGDQADALYGSPLPARETSPAG